jgi:hypothetical protein
MLCITAKKSRQKCAETGFTWPGLHFITTRVPSPGQVVGGVLIARVEQVAGGLLFHHQFADPSSLDMALFQVGIDTIVLAVVNFIAVKTLQAIFLSIMPTISYFIYRYVPY